MKTDRALKIHSANEIFIFLSGRGNNRLCASFLPSFSFLYVSSPFSLRPNSAESVKKIVDKSSIKFIHAVKLDTKTGKTEDRVLVRSSGSF